MKKVFIGSSKEAQKELREVASWLQNCDLLPIPWDEPTLFRPGENTFQRLIELTKEVDAAVFIFSEDDSVWYRNDNVLQPRDNLLIEYGLFSGTLGPTRTVICRKDAPKLATDILGIIHIDISSKNKDRAQLQLQHWAQDLIYGKPTTIFRRPMLWKNRHEIRPPLSRRIEQSNENIFFTGLSLVSTFDHYKNVLIETLNSKPNLRIRLLLLHPDSLHTPADQYFADRNIKNEILKVIDRMKNFYDNLNESAKDNLEIMLTHYLPRFAAKIFDEKTMLLNFYLYNSRAQENPVIEIKKEYHPDEFKIILKSLEELYNYPTSGEIKKPNIKLVDKGKWIGIS